jgi:predicted nucleic acid-binding protein
VSPEVLRQLAACGCGRNDVTNRVERAFLDEVARGAYQLESFGTDDMAQTRAVLERYADLDLGLAEASILVLANRHDVTDVLTLDERHFRALLSRKGRPFRLLPADSLP